MALRFAFCECCSSDFNRSDLCSSLVPCASVLSVYVLIEVDVGDLARPWMAQVLAREQSGAGLPQPVVSRAGTKQEHHAP